MQKKLFLAILESMLDTAQHVVNVQEQDADARLSEGEVRSILGQHLKKNRIAIIAGALKLTEAEVRQVLNDNPQTATAEAQTEQTTVAAS